jgi:hypothetical protein
VSAPRVTGRGLGSPRNGMPLSGGYVYGATRPRPPAAPIAEPSEVVRRIRAEITARAAGEQPCEDCGHPAGSWGCYVTCEEGS